MLNGHGPGYPGVQGWGPMYSLDEPPQTWVDELNKLGLGLPPLIVVNGPDARARAATMQKEMRGPVVIRAISGAGSIGKAQALAIDYFLGTGAQLLVRLDTDMQIPAGMVLALAEAYQRTGRAVIWGQRSSNSSGGAIRWAGNLLLRYLTAQRLPGDLNSGTYALSRKAAALMSGHPFPKYPEPRMLALARDLGLSTDMVVVRVRVRSTGHSSIRGMAGHLKLGVKSLMEAVCRP